MKNIRNFVVLFSIVASALAANAQTFHGKFQLTRETRWGKAVLPAGRYSLTLDSVHSPIVIRSEDRKLSAMAMAEFGTQAAPGGSYIFITGSGSDRQVRAVNLPMLGRSLVFKPLTRRERETLIATAPRTVPIQLAKK